MRQKNEAPGPVRASGAGEPGAGRLDEGLALDSTTAPASHALAILDREALVVELVAHRLSRGEPLEAHAGNLELAAARIAEVRHRREAKP